MIMKESYMQDLIDAIKNTPDGDFTGKCKEEVLKDEKLLEKAAYDFQKNHEYDCDYDWSLKEAMSLVLEISIFGHGNIPKPVKNPKLCYVVVTYYSFDMDMPMKKCESHEEAVKYIETLLKDEVRVLEDEEDKIKGTDFMVETDCSGAWARIRNLKDGTYTEWNIGTLEV